jgi:CRP-like cAMP-binding protein
MPLGRVFPLPPVAHHNLTLVPKRLDVSQRPAPAFDILDFLNRFSPGKTRREYLAGEYVFSQGDTSNAVFYIQSGRVNLTLVSMSGKEAVIAHLPEGSFFGEAALAAEQSRLSSASALQSSVIVRIDKTAMLGLLHSEQGFAQKFREHLLARNIRMQADLVDHLFNSSEKRLARLLMMMANFGQNTNPAPVIAKISQETLADMIGTTRSRVSFFLNRFRSLGYIDYNCSGMRINSSLVNIVLHD